MAGVAETEHVDPMAVELEPLGIGELVELLGDGALEGRRRGDVAHLAAVGAQEVVVVLGEVFGQLEPGELVVGGDPSDHAGGLEVDQVAVGRAPRKVGESEGDVADVHRVAGTGQQADNGSAPLRVALVDAAKPVLDQGVQIVGYLMSCCHGPVLKWVFVAVVGGVSMAVVNVVVVVAMGEWRTAATWSVAVGVSFMVAPRCDGRRR